MKFTCLFVLILAIHLNHADAGPKFPVKKSKKRNLYSSSSPTFVAFNFTWGLWQQPIQPGMNALRNSQDFYLEYGWDRKPLSLIGGASFNTAHTQDIFVFKPNLVYLGVKYTPAIKTLPAWVSPYLAGGITGWEAVLTDENYDGIVNYQHKEEVDRGLGGFVRAGISMRYKNFSLGPEFTYFGAQNGEYLAGAFEKQPINPGFFTFGINLDYRINFKKYSGTQCPTYY